MRTPARVARRARRKLWQRRLARASRKAAADLQLCTDVLEWSLARDPNTEWQQLLPAREKTLAAPRTVEPTMLDAYTSRLTRSQRSSYLVRVDGASVIGRNGLLRLPDGSFAVQSVYTTENVLSNPDLGLPALKKPVHKAGNYVSLVGGWASEGNYYHWIHDSVKRLGGVFPFLPEGLRYIVPSPLLPFQREVLELLGIREEQLAPFAADDVWQVEHLYFVSPASNSGSHRADADRWLRDTILEASQVQVGPPTRRLYLSRGDAPSRRVLNEAEVIDFLGEFGFEVCALASVSVRDKAALFAQAEAVVSAHGAGLTSIMFAPAGLRVLDVIPPHMSPAAYVYWTLAHELDQEYWYCIGGEASDGSNDMTIPLDKLAATIERWRL